jgi:hypothetical protein
VAPLYKEKKKENPQTSQRPTERLMINAMALSCVEGGIERDVAAEARETTSPMRTPSSLVSVLDHAIPVGLRTREGPVCLEKGAARCEIHRKGRHTERASAG